jgi:clan AA aspartic protease
MGIFMETISLENIIDRAFAEGGYIKDSDIRVLTVKAMPDTGAWTLVINEDIRSKLGLKIEDSVTATLADGKAAVYPLTSPVKIRWKNRSTTLPAIVAESAKTVLLGALPLEGMDLIVDPVRQELVGAHGEDAVYCLY